MAQAAQDTSKLTVTRIRERIEARGGKVPLGLRRHELLAYLKAVEEHGTRGNEAPLMSGQCYDRLVAKSADPVLPWKEHLARYGWTTMPVPGLHVDAYVDDVYDWLESCSPVSLAAIKGDPHGDDYPRLRVPAFKRHDPSTWTPSNVPPNLHGIMKHYCGQLDWQWRLRELCYPLFSELYGDDDLLAAFDGFCFLRPLELSGRSGPRETADEQPAGPAVSGYKQWLHLDQDRLHELSDGHEPGVLSCAQGLVTLSESGPEDGGLVLVEKSHLAFAGYLERHALAGFGEWLLVDMEDEVLSELDVIKVCAPAGHLVLWDSRVVHANCPPRGQSTPRPRICAYVSMQPRSHASKKDLARRLAMFEGCRQTGHWVAGHALKDTGRHPYTRGAPIVMPERPFALPELSALAGDSSATNDGRRRSSLLLRPRERSESSTEVEAPHS